MINNTYIVVLQNASRNAALTFEFDDHTTAMQFARIAKNFRDEEIDVTISVQDGR